MISFFKRLYRDRRGNALILAALSMPLLLGSVGLATDTIQWTLWKRQLQRAADSAAFAGAYARFQDKSSTDAATHDLAMNNHLWVPLMTGYPQVTQPADTATFVRAVEVRLQVQQALTFSSMFMSSAPIITATARAAATDSGSYCVVALENTNTSGIIIQGSSIVNMGCGMISDSPAASISVGVNGNGHNVTAVPVAGVGGVPDINGVAAADELSNQLPMLDPYKNTYNTVSPVACTDMATHAATRSAADITAGFTQALSPGCYTGNNQFKFTGGKTRLNPGVYYLDNVDFDAQGGTIVGDGVTIILTGTTPKQIKLNGNATIQLTAPTATIPAVGATPAVPGTCGTFSGTNSCNFTKMLFIQSTNAVWSNNSNIINGSSTSKFDGAIYIPNQQVSFSGSSGAITKCAMVVAKRVEFAGNANLQNDTTGCTANSKVKGKIIRLIA
jgi:Flp pilus assembly protein TadG